MILVGGGWGQRGQLPYFTFIEFETQTKNR
jgi:hypothetical protein